MASGEAQLPFLAPYGPDFDPIEMAFSKIKALLAGIIAADPSAFGGFDALTVDHARRRAGRVTFRISCHRNQMMVDLAKQADVAPN